VLTSQRMCIDNSLNITNQPVNNILDCAQFGGSNYLPIPTDQKENDDYNVESEESENFLEEDYDGDEIIDRVVNRMDRYDPLIGWG
jgi:hypothetical protein